MDYIEFTKLKPGDTVRHKSGSQEFMVFANYGDRITAVAVADLTNPEEWEVVSKIDKHNHLTDRWNDKGAEP